MAIWTKERLVREIEKSPFSPYQKIRQHFRDTTREMTLGLSDEEIDQLIGVNSKLLETFYFIWNEEYQMAFEIEGHLVNRYGAGQHVFKADFAALTAATDVFSVSFGMDVVFLPLDLGENTRLGLVEIENFEKITAYLTTNTAPNEKIVEPQLRVELAAYRRYLDIQARPYVARPE